jgi:hypothetical protein
MGMSMGVIVAIMIMVVIVLMQIGFGHGFELRLAFGTAEKVLGPLMHQRVFGGRLGDRHPAYRIDRLGVTVWRGFEFRFALRIAEEIFDAVVDMAMLRGFCLHQHAANGIFDFHNRSWRFSRRKNGLC